MLQLTKVYTGIKIALLIAVIAAGVVGYKTLEARLSGTVTAKDMQAMIDAQNRTFLQLTENAVRANTEINDAKLKEETRKLDNKITEKISQSNEKIAQIGVVVAKQGRNVVVTSSTTSYKPGTADKDAYEFRKIYSKDAKGNDYPVAWVVFYPNRELGKQWEYGTYGLEYNMKMIQTQQRSGTTNNYAEAWIQNNEEDESKGKQYPLSIQSAEFIQKSPDGKSFMFAPAFDMGIIGVYSMTNKMDFGAMANVSFFGYGKTKKELDWRFIAVGVGGNGDNWWGEFSPVQYNIGNNIPLMTNLWVGPYFILDKKLNPGGGLGLSVRF